MHLLERFPSGRLALLLLSIGGAVAASGCVDSRDPDGPGDAVSPGTNLGTTASARQWLLVRATGLYPANPGFAVNRTELVAGANVTLTFRNDDQNPLGKHDWYLEDAEGAHTGLLGVGDEEILVFFAPLAPGEYRYLCHVDGHEARGMWGTMNVVAA